MRISFQESKWPATPAGWMQNRFAAHLCFVHPNSLKAQSISTQWSLAYVCFTPSRSGASLYCRKQIRSRYAKKKATVFDSSEGRAKVAAKVSPFWICFASDDFFAIGSERISFLRNSLPSNALSSFANWNPWVSSHQVLNQMSIWNFKSPQSKVVRRVYKIFK